VTYALDDFCDLADSVAAWMGFSRSRLYDPSFARDCSGRDGHKSHYWPKNGLNQSFSILSSIGRAIAGPGNRQPIHLQVCA
jgi:hypothetical protein